MYADPRHLRDHEIKVRLSEKAYRLVESMAGYKGTQRAVLARDLIEEGLERLVEESSRNSTAA